jgi:hypothetical protein
MSFRTGLVGEASRTDGRCGAGRVLAPYRCVFSVRFLAGADECADQCADLR